MPDPECTCDYECAGRVDDTDCPLHGPSALPAERSPIIDEVVDVAATILTGVVMGLGGVLAVLVRPTIFDEVHNAFVYALTHPEETPDA
jgi:hypothetical protein